MFMLKTIASPGITSAEDIVLTAHQKNQVRDKQHHEWLSIQKSRQKGSKKRSEIGTITYLIRQKKHTEALVLLKELHDRNNGFDDISLYILMGKTHYALGLYEGAVQTCDRSFSKGLFAAVLYNIKAEAQHQMEYHEEALRTCHEALYMHKRYNHMTYTIQASVHLVLERYRDAIDTCNTAFKENLVNVFTYIIKAKAQDILGYRAEAVHTCEKARASGLDTVETNNILAQVQFNQGDYEGAIATCDRSIHDPSRKGRADAFTFILKAKAQDKLERHEEAIDTLNIAITQGSATIETYVTRTTLQQEHASRSKHNYRTALLPELRALLAKTSPLLVENTEKADNTFAAIVHLRSQVPSDPHIDRTIMAVCLPYLEKKIRGALVLASSGPVLAHDQKLNRKEMYDRQEAADRKKIGTFFSDSEKQFIALFPDSTRKLAIRTCDTLEVTIAALRTDLSAYAIYRIKKYERLLTVLGPEGLGLFNTKEFHTLAFALHRNAFESGGLRVEHMTDQLSKLIEHYSGIGTEGRTPEHAEALFEVMPKGLNITEHGHSPHYGPARPEVLGKTLALYDLLPNSKERELLYSMMFLSIIGRNWTALTVEVRNTIFRFLEEHQTLKISVWNELITLQRDIEEQPELRTDLPNNANAFYRYTAVTSGQGQD